MPSLTLLGNGPTSKRERQRCWFAVTTKLNMEAIVLSGQGSGALEPMEQPVISPTAADFDAARRVQLFRLHRYSQRVCSGCGVSYMGRCGQRFCTKACREQAKNKRLSGDTRVANLVRVTDLVWRDSTSGALYQCLGAAPTGLVVKEDGNQ
jgi:hypothetical protein